jgi:predicted nucleotidyltransferase
VNEEVGMSKIRSTLVFPTPLHQAVGYKILEYFSKIRSVDTVLVVNSCARGQAVPESDLDFAILVQPSTSIEAIAAIEGEWANFSETDPKIKEYKSFSKFSHLHLDIVTGNYVPTPVELGAPVDSFELEIGNQVCYSAPMRVAGRYFEELQDRWLPYYGRELRLNRFETLRAGCSYEIDHISLFADRGLFFQAFDLLYRAFQKFLQVLFIGSAIYPIAYNKWIKYQIEEILVKPELYSKLPPIISLSNIESHEIIQKAEMLQLLLNQVELV